MDAVFSESATPGLIDAYERGDYGCGMTNRYVQNLGEVSRYYGRTINAVYKWRENGMPDKGPLGWDLQAIP